MVVVGVCVCFNLGRKMQPGRVFMKEHPIRAVKHTDSMVRIPATPLNQQLQQLIHHSLDTHIAYAHVLEGAQVLSKYFK